MLEVINAAKSYASTEALKTVTCSLKKGTIVALLGPSGSGKSTLLRCLSRLESLTSGQILFNKKDIQCLSKSDIGMVFQGFHLFPHLTVIENLIYAPVKVNNQEKSETHQEAEELLKKFGLLDKKNSYPAQLSGGQKQRVAIARTLMMHPTLLLFDEPTSALDPEMVGEVAQLIHSLKDNNRLIIMATHELRIAQMIADQILFLDHGELAEDVSAQQFFANPQSFRAQTFIRQMVAVTLSPPL